MATTATSEDATTATTTTFAVGHRVVLHGLKGAAEHNGKVGIVQSDLNSGGRHEVELVEDNSKSKNNNGEKKLLGIKPINLMFEPRPLESLSVAELKFLLTSNESSSSSSSHSTTTKIISPKEFTGMDKSELRTKVSQMEKSTDPMDLAIRLSRRARPQQSDNGSNNDNSSNSKNKKKSASKRNAATGGNNNAHNYNNMQQQQQHHQAAEQLSNMSPEQLMQQAQMMRSMDFGTLRRMNPQMANMSDGQINMAIQQLEMMAMNPSMVQQAANQMKNMTNEEFERQKQQVMGSGNSGGASATSPNMGGGNGVNPENMTPEQLKEQARMMRSMDPDTIRRMNPALANMTDDQIRMAATQMEQMAENPEMMKFAKEQMKNMSQDDIRKMQQTGTMPSGAAGGAGGASGAPDPQQMLRDLSPEQLKQMVKMMKQNPEMMRQMLPGGGMGMNQDQINKTLEALGNMDEAQLEQTLRAAQMFQQYTAPIENAWKKVNGLVGGQLRNILLLLFALSMVMLFRYLFFSPSSGVPPDTIVSSNDNLNVATGGSSSGKIQPSEVYVGQEEDEFSEF